MDEERFRGIGCIRGNVIITTCFIEKGRRYTMKNTKNISDERLKEILAITPVPVLEPSYFNL